MTIRQRRKAIKELAQSIVGYLRDVEEYCGTKKPFALTEQEFGWQQKALDYVNMLSCIDINEKVDEFPIATAHPPSDPPFLKFKTIKKQ